MLIIDAHLDLAYNALRGRDVLRPAAEQTPDADGIPTVGLPDLRAGGVRLICATIFCEPASGPAPSAGYRTPDEAHAQAMRQLRWYQRQFALDTMTPVTTPAELAAAVAEPAAPPSATSITALLLPNPAPPAAPPPINAILLLEGADPIRTPDDLEAFVEAGLRAVGLAWRRTRYAGGTGAPGPLTPDGIKLIPHLDRHHLIHDTSHLAEESFWQLLDLTDGPVMASHSNCRAIVPTDRQLSDEMIRALVRRGSVIGINFYNKFLLPPEPHTTRQATLADLVTHIRHLCDLAGDARHVGLGTDMDGGFGREQIPAEITTAADLPRLADALAAADFPDEDIHGILGQNWVRFFTAALEKAR
jgi:membrane dipeptidase